MKQGIRIISKCVHGNVLALAGLSFYFFLLPVVLIFMDIRDPAWRGEGIPRIAWRVHKHISPLYARWARERIQSGVAATLDLYDVPSTEWPVFGSVFYLLSTESLQDEWKKNPSLSAEAPNVYARDAIEAAKDIITDTNHHWWVRTHWGDDYLHEENVFFRSLLIQGLTSYDRLTGNTIYRDFLKDQCVTLAESLDQSPVGVLNDYPAECYPIDVLAAIASIQKADALLGMDQSGFIRRAKRAFEGSMLDKRGLIPYCVDATSGEPIAMYPTGKGDELEGPSRGIGNSYVLIFVRDLWPELAPSWYQLYERHFWQDRGWAEGWREFPKDLPDLEWTYDVDAGPIIAGFSPAANAFGLAAAKVNGRMDHVYTLGSQVLAACWPLWHGELLGAKVLSNPHAPYLGEVNLLWLFTRMPAKGAPLVYGGRIPAFVYLMTGLYALIGMGILLMARSVYRRWEHCREWAEVDLPWLQFFLWLVCVIAAVIFLGMGRLGYGCVGILVAQLLPRWRIPCEVLKWMK